MLDMGFLPDIKRLQSHLPKRKNRYSFLTFSQDIRKLAKTMLCNPVEVDVANKNTAADTVGQYLYAVDKSQKAKLLSHLITEEGWRIRCSCLAEQHLARTDWLRYLRRPVLELYRYMVIKVNLREQKR